MSGYWLGEGPYMLMTLLRSIVQSRCAPSSRTWGQSVRAECWSSLVRLSEWVLLCLTSSQQTGGRELGAWEQIHQWNNSQLEMRTWKTLQDCTVSPVQMPLPVEMYSLIHQETPFPVAHSPPFTTFLCLKSISTACSAQQPSLSLMPPCPIS